MIEYYEQLMNEEQQELTRIIKLLFRQTFLLEHKYEKRSGRFVFAGRNDCGGEAATAGQHLCVGAEADL